MKTTTMRWTGAAWACAPDAQPSPAADLVLWFAAPGLACDDQLYADLKHRFPMALIAGCSTAGQIIGDQAADETAVAAVVSFDTGKVRGVRADAVPGGSVIDLGARLAHALAAPDLKGVCILSDGAIDGSALVEGLAGALPPEVVLAGGLAGDGAVAGKTRVGLDATLTPGAVVAVGFYGADLSVDWGSAGGWESFGPERRITRSEGNVLLELDGRPALELYRQYLAAPDGDVPFPLVIRPQPRSPHEIVRAVVGIDEARQGLIFAGGVPTGWSAQLLRATAHDLAEGAAEAAQQAGQGGADAGALALLVSCMGRKSILGDQVGDEVERACGVLGDVATLGFYAYSGIGPHGNTGKPALHNQTMAITVVREAA